MLVEFDVVLQNKEELYMKELEAELKGEASVSFFNKGDKIVSEVIDMTKVVSFLETNTYYNEDKLPSVSATFESIAGNMYTVSGLLVEYKDFKKLAEMALRKEIKKVNQIIGGNMV